MKALKNAISLDGHPSRYSTHQAPSKHVMTIINDLIKNSVFIINIRNLQIVFKILITKLDASIASAYEILCILLKIFGVF